MSLRGIPLMVLALVVYNLFVLFSSLPAQEVFYGHWVQDPTTHAVSLRGGQVLTLQLPSGLLRVYLGDVMIAFGLLLMGIETVKATYTLGFGMIDRLLSPLLFVVFLVAFLLVPKCATSVFFFLTVTAGFNVVVGEAVGIRSARRDITFGNS
jgi:hypothetical protein